MPRAASDDNEDDFGSAPAFKLRRGRRIISKPFGGAIYIPSERHPCVSTTGLGRKAHEYDRDGVCIYCAHGSMDEQATLGQREPERNRQWHSRKIL